MSKNPAWNAYNEEVRKINEAYEATVKPLRVALSADLDETNVRFFNKINPLTQERDKILAGLKKDYTEQVSKSEKLRTDAMKRAHAVLKAELEAKKQVAA